MTFLGFYPKIDFFKFWVEGVTEFVLIVDKQINSSVRLVIGSELLEKGENFLSYLKSPHEFCMQGQP